MPDRVQALFGEIEDHLQHLPAATEAAHRRELVAAVLDALRELRELLSPRRWPRVVRGDLPPGATVIRLTEEESTALLADLQDANQQLREQLAFVEAQLLACREYLHAATAVDDAAVTDAAAVLLRAADLTPEQRAAVTTLRAAAARGGTNPPKPSTSWGRTLPQADSADVVTAPRGAQGGPGPTTDQARAADRAGAEETAAHRAAALDEFLAEYEAVHGTISTGDMERAMRRLHTRSRGEPPSP